MEGPTPLEIARNVVSLARRAGAEQCDAIVSMYTEANVTVRLGELEKLIEAGSMSLGLRVINGGRTAVCSTSDLSPAALERFAAEAVDLASISEPDEFAGLPEPELLSRATTAAGLSLYDEHMETLSTDERIRMAKACEGAALGFDARVNNSDGASLSTRIGQLALANSYGFEGSYPATSISLMVEAIADDADGKKRNGYWYSAERSLHRLMDPEEIGRIAARRTIDQLGARKIATRQSPVVFEPMMTVALMGDLVGCATGSALYRGATFLASRAGKALGSPLVNISDDPSRPGGLGSRPFDGEGVGARRNDIFRQGVFSGFLFDCYTARRTGNSTTGSAQRGVESLPAPGASTLIFEAGNSEPGSIIAGVTEGLYLTTLMGNGFNPTTGDYSRGAAGFWIQDGKLAYPVSEVNISGHMDSMLAGVDAVGDDLTSFGSSSAPTIRIREMTISGT
ncbi:MAG: TldD/PmbA family protein [Dehalococcoidia bacterium]|uniref:TldD/PmbA family protein n=1 Tax=Candidatus Amarobacter glycogenicus TaxID=3140699 RepID=UPI003135D5DA|nr:TldD/PmbA family protein [Dehalococcoidia bacterium]